MKDVKIEELLGQVCDGPLDTVKHYTDEEKFGRELFEQFKTGEAELSEKFILDAKGKVSKASVYEKKGEMFYGNTFGSCFFTNFAKWGREHKPSGSVMLVLLDLLANMRYYNYVLVSQAKLSNKLKLDRSTVSSSLNFLENTGVLDFVPESHLPAFIKAKPKIERKWYRVSIDMFWRGAASEIDRAPKGYKMKFRERDNEVKECKSLEDALRKIDNFFPTED